MHRLAIRNQFRRFRRPGTDSHGAAGAGNDCQVVQFSNGTIDAKPIHAASFFQVDYLNAAPWFGVGIFQALIQLQAFETFIAWFGEADEGQAVMKRQAAQKAWAKYARFEMSHAASFAANHDTQFSRAAVEQPQLTLVHAR